MSKPGVNPNVPQVPHPIADLGALRTVTEQLKQGFDSLAGFRGGQFSRAVTFQDLIDMGVIDALVATSPDGSATPPDGAQYSPSDPASTAAAAPGVMMGLRAVFTPRRTGALFVAVSGVAGNTLAGSSLTLQMRTGVGTPPINGAGISGQTGGPSQTLSVAANNQQIGFCTQALMAALTLRTTYWFDLSLSTSAGAAFLKNISVSIVEL